MDHRAATGQRDQAPGRPRRAHPGPTLQPAIDGSMLRMRKHAFREVKVACLFDAGISSASTRPPGTAAHALRGPSRRPERFRSADIAATHGAGVTADGSNAISQGDGAPWVWYLVQLHWPAAVEVFDYFHLSELSTHGAQAVWGVGQHAGARLGARRRPSLALAMRAGAPPSAQPDCGPPTDTGQPGRGRAPALRPDARASLRYGAAAGLRLPPRPSRAPSWRRPAASPAGHRWTLEPSSRSCARASVQPSLPPDVTTVAPSGSCMPRRTVVGSGVSVTNLRAPTSSALPMSTPSEPRASEPRAPYPPYPVPSGKIVSASSVALREQPRPNRAAGAAQARARTHVLRPHRDHLPKIYPAMPSVLHYPPPPSPPHSEP